LNPVFDDMLQLLSKGFAPYTGGIDEQVYADADCENVDAARWMHREGVFICLGCQKQCHQANPKGFELIVAVPARARRLAFAVLPAVSADDLLDKKKLLSVKEVEFILSVSPRTVYAMLEEGILDRHPDKPTRITVESVRREAERRRIG
jgi:predicted DNA-binding transcriptional regulator AlpA